MNKENKFTKKIEDIIAKQKEKKNAKQSSEPNLITVVFLCPFIMVQEGISDFFTGRVKNFKDFKYSSQEIVCGLVMIPFILVIYSFLFILGLMDIIKNRFSNFTKKKKKKKKKK